MDIDKMYESVKSLILHCGEILKDVNHEKEASLKSDGSLLTKYDLIIDNKLKEGLNKIYNCPILSEEHEEEIKDTYFVVDPIDGTQNFNANFELFAIMVAFVKNKETIFSYIYIPKLNKLYSAIKNKGAYLNDKKVIVKEDNNNIIGTCNISIKSLEIIKQMWQQKSVSFRSIGSAGIALAYIADGTFDFYFSTHIGGSWDAIAGKLLIEEAGGIVKYNKNSDGHYEIIAGTKTAIDLIENAGLKIEESK